MASTATARNRLNLQGTGDNTGVWGSILNNQGLVLVDEALDGVTSLAITGNVTLTSINYTTDQARKRTLKLTGTPGATYVVTIPSVEKFYLVHNATNAAQTIRAAGVGVSVQPASMKPIYCDGTDCFGQADTLTAPVGTVTDFAGSTAPTGWLLCYGQAVSRAGYSTLFSVIGTTYGTGDGSTTFNVPDLRGRTSVGKDDMGGVAANRLTGGTGGIVGATLGAVGGEQAHQLTTSELASHAHPGSTSTVPLNQGGGTPNSVVTDAHTTQTLNGSGTLFTLLDSFTKAVTSLFGTATVASQGNDVAHNNVQPSMVLNKIIYAGV